ncbi:MAG: hypothetical protein HN742_40335 [Lentisphaerae bacterium]|jgi:hypothetical protein|nr:hypothetical protein [Lentisphaerota bacterium]MBT4817844.1 hypothetical protein [Lentisphaerota bacterium]MBT5604777.1 hypothetical protein [Lentisphaerota bacterium]MBT7060572.1 hypothetical protein [Lentisphaerota bacterium]MBT7848185.1 hypothetical protein [Lentisphaerota bacterium]
MRCADQGAVLATVLLTAILCGPVTAGLFDWGWREDFEDVGRWKAEVSWLSNADVDATLETTEGIAHFVVPTPGRGMKWRCHLRPVTHADTPFLIVTYRARGLRTDFGEYFIYVDDEGKREARPLLLRHLVPDNQWHTVAVNLSSVVQGESFRAMAIQVQAAKGAGAELWVKDIWLAESVPAGVEEINAVARSPVRPDVYLPLNGEAATRWTARTGWLSNATTDSAVAKAGRADRLCVSQAGRGMKWSWFFEDEVVLTGHRFLSMRYRATRSVPRSDYALCILAEANADGRDYAPAIMPNDLRHDGRWHTVTVPIDDLARRFPRIRGVAAQVQAGANDASLEITSIGFLSAVPMVPAADLLGDVGTARRMAGFQAIALAGQGRVPLQDALEAMRVADWSAREDVALSDIPFVLPGADAVLPGTGLVERAAATVSVGRTCSQIFLLTLAALRGGEEEVYRREGRLTEIREVDRFRISLRYTDGTTEGCFPWNVTQETFALSDGAQVLCVFADPTRTVDRLTLTDNSDGAGYVVVAVTCRAGPRVIKDPDDTWLGLAVRPLKPARDESLVRRTGDVLRIMTPLATCNLSLTPFPRIRELRNDAVGDELFGPDHAAAYLYTPRANGAAIAPRSFRLAECRTNGDRAVLTYAAEAPIGVRFQLDVSVTDTGEMALGGRLTNASASPLELALDGPSVGPVRLGNELTETCYLYPGAGCSIGSRPVVRRDRFGGRFPLQFMAGFNPVTNSGLYLRTEGQREMRDYALSKDDNGLTFGIAYPRAAVVPPGGEFATVRTIVGFSNGDWHAAFDAYTRWLQTWYRPSSKRKQWFREVFNFRQRFLHSYDPLYDPATGTYRLERALSEADTHFGGIEYLHLFDWGNVPRIGRVYGRIGDHSPFDEYLSGGVKAFRRAIQGVQDAGVPVGLYIEGYLLQEKGRLGQAHGREWQIVTQRGDPLYWQDSTEMMVCSGIPDWQNVQAETYAARVRELGVDGMYLDQFGFANSGKDCWSQTHGHPRPSYTVESEFELSRQVRDGIDASKPDVALYSEETPCDVNSQNQDGSFTYHMRHCRGTRPWVPLHMPRFAIPSFKTFEILVCDRPMGGWTEGVKWTFFNGEGIWLEGRADEWFRPETLAAIRKCHAILRAHRDAFTSDRPRPLVPTLAPGIFANCFPIEGKVVYTLYNARHRTYRGPALSIMARKGVRCRDLWRGSETTPRAGKEKRLELEVGLQARDVGALMVTW